MAGKQSTKRPFDASASPTYEEASKPLTRASKKIKVTRANKTSSSGDSSTSMGFTSSGLTWKEEIFSAMRASRRLTKLQDTELEVLCMCLYLKYKVIPEKLLLNYSKEDSNLIQLAVNNLVSEGILTRNDEMGILTICNFNQSKFRLFINNEITNFKEEAILDKVLHVLITELSTRKEGRFPYSGYMQDIVLNAIGVWELCFKYERLIEKYFDSLEIFAIASYEEMNSKSSSVLFLSKTIRQLSAMYGHEDFKTLSVKLTMTSISAKTGKVKQALDELEIYTKFIESRVTPDIKSLLPNALEKKVNLLRNIKNYSEALVTCNKLLELDVNKYRLSNDLLIHIKHLKSKILNESGQLDEAVKICVEISKQPSANNGTNADDIKYTQAKILHSNKKYKECLTLLDSVIETRSSKFNCKHSSVLAARTEKAETLEDAGEYDLALKELNSILTICEEKYGVYDIKTLNVKSTIARVLMSKGDEKDSFALISEMLKSANEKFGAHSSEVKDITNFKNKLIESAKSPKTMESQNKKSDHSSSSIVVKKKNNYSEYKKYYLSEYNMPPETSSEDVEKRAFQPLRNKNFMQAYSEATFIYNKIKTELGDDCPALEQPLEILLEANQRLKNQKGELEALQKLYRLKMILYGEITSSNFNILRKIADLQNTLDLKAEALVSYETLYKYIISLRGPDDVRTYNILRKIALLEVSLYQFDDAIKHFEQLLQIIESKKLEVDEAFQANYFIALCYLKKGRLEEAFQRCSKLMKDYITVHKGKKRQKPNKYHQLNDFIQNIYRKKKL